MYMRNRLITLEISLTLQIDIKAALSLVVLIQSAFPSTNEGNGYDDHAHTIRVNLFTVLSLHSTHAAMSRIAQKTLLSMLLIALT